MGAHMGNLEKAYLPGLQDMAERVLVGVVSLSVGAL